MSLPLTRLKTPGHKGLVYSCRRPQCPVHCSTCIAGAQGRNLYWMSSFYVSYLCYVLGTVRQALDTTSHRVSQPPYARRERISERLSNSPKLKQLPEGRISSETPLCPQRPNILQHVTKPHGSFVTRAIPTTGQRTASVPTLTPCSLTVHN